MRHLPNQILQETALTEERHEEGKDWGVHTVLPAGGTYRLRNEMQAWRVMLDFRVVSLIIR